MDDRDSRPDGAAIGVQPDISAAFSAFYREFHQTLVGFLVSQGARLSDASDIAQDTMIKAYERWPEIHHPEPWTRRVATRALVRHLAGVTEEPVEDPAEHGSPPSALTSVEAWEQRHEVLRLLDRLPPRQRQDMVWAVDGCTPAETAEDLDITPDAVRANLLRARRTLMPYLEATGDER